MMKKKKILVLLTIFIFIFAILILEVPGQKEVELSDEIINEVKEAYKNAQDNPSKTLSPELRASMALEELLIKEGIPISGINTREITANIINKNEPSIAINTPATSTTGNDIQPIKNLPDNNYAVLSNNADGSTTYLFNIDGVYTQVKMMPNSQIIEETTLTESQAQDLLSIRQPSRSNLIESGQASATGAPQTPQLRQSDNYPPTSDHESLSWDGWYLTTDEEGTISVASEQYGKGDIFNVVEIDGNTFYKSDIDGKIFNKDGLEVDENGVLVEGGDISYIAKAIADESLKEKETFPQGMEFAVSQQYIPIDRLQYASNFNNWQSTGIFSVNYRDPITGDLYSEQDAKRRIENYRIQAIIQQHPEWSPERIEQELFEQDMDRQISGAYRELFSNALSMLMGPAYGGVSEICREEHESSDPTSETPHSGNSGPTPNNLNESCIGSFTTITAQGRKRYEAPIYIYDVSWTITPCKQDINYQIWLQNSLSDRIGLTTGGTGVINVNLIESKTREFRYGTDYQAVCIQVSDPTVGDNGFFCFPIIES